MHLLSQLIIQPPQILFLFFRVHALTLALFDYFQLDLDGFFECLLGNRVRLVVILALFPNLELMDTLQSLHHELHVLQRQSVEFVSEVLYFDVLFSFTEPFGLHKQIA